MRLFLFALLLANVVMVLVLQTHRPAGLEPERLALQKHAERLTVVSLPQPPVPQRAPGECIEAGDFTNATAEKFESALAQLALPVLPHKRVVQPPPSQIVLLPPQTTEAAAARRLAQLRELGFKDVSVIRDGSARRWGISLGVFSKPELAEAQLAALRQVGVTDARIDEHPLNTTRVAYQLVGLEEAAMTELRKLVSAQAGIGLRDCD